MAVVLHIRKPGEPERSVELLPGEHTLGRAPDNTVVLADPSVSSRHARLTVSGKGLQIADLDSLNGVFARGRRITTQAFSGDIEFEIGVFTLLASWSTGKEPAEAPSLLDAGPARRLMDVRLFVPAVALALALATALAVQAPLRERFEEARLREAAKRGFILARYLAEMNVFPLRAKKFEQTRAEPVSAEEGVLYAYVTDPYGKVLAPAKSVGKLLDTPQLSLAVKQGTMKVGTGPDGESVICWPVKDLDTVLGAAVVGYATPAAAQTAFRDTALALIAPLGLAGLASVGLVLLVLAPVRRLAEEAGLALKQGRRRLDYAPPYKELALVAQAFDRMLRLLPGKGGAEPSPGRTPPPGHAQTPASAARPDTPSGLPRNMDHTTPFLSNLELLDRPWCLADVGQFTVLMHNPLFLSLLGREELPLPAHMLEVFADPQALEALTALIEQRDTPVIQAHIRGKDVSVTRKEVPEQDGFAVFVFEENPHG